MTIHVKPHFLGHDHERPIWPSWGFAVGIGLHRITRWSNRKKGYVMTYTYTQGQRRHPFSCKSQIIYRLFRLREDLEDTHISGQSDHYWLEGLEKTLDNLPESKSMGYLPRHTSVVWHGTVSPTSAVVLSHDRKWLLEQPHLPHQLLPPIAGVPIPWLKRLKRELFAKR